MRTHSMGRFSATAAATFWISGESFFTCVWQFMHTPEAGTPAWRLFSAPTWQYWQSSSYWPACTAWEKATGCSGM